jgi:hypothetical protein
MSNLPKHGEIIEEDGVRYRIYWKEAELKGDGPESITDEVITLCLSEFVGIVEEPIRNYIETLDRRIKGEIVDDPLDKVEAVDTGAQNISLRRGDVFVDFLKRTWYRDNDGRVYQIIKKQLKTVSYDPSRVEFRDRTLEEVEKQADEIKDRFSEMLYRGSHNDSPYLP